MRMLFGYLKSYWQLCLVALSLAAVNQVFSLLDPLIFRHIIDGYVTKAGQFTPEQFLKGVGLLLLGSMGVAFVSRVAKNFQDYFLNVIIQRLGARLYADHWSRCPRRGGRATAAATAERRQRRPARPAADECAGRRPRR